MKTKFGERAFSFAVLVAGNSLPVAIRLSSVLAAFSRHKKLKSMHTFQTPIEFHELRFIGWSVIFSLATLL